MTGSKPNALRWSMLLLILLIISFNTPVPSSHSSADERTSGRSGMQDSEYFVKTPEQDPVYPNESHMPTQQTSLPSNHHTAGGIPTLTAEPSHISLGPSSSEGKFFNLTVGLEELECTYNLTRFDFCVSFNSSIIEVTRVYQGSLEEAPWNQHGTYLESSVEDTSPNQTHLFVRGSLLSNYDGQWSVFPNSSITLAVVEFKALKQSSYFTYTSEIEIDQVCLLDSSSNQIPCNSSVTILYTMLPLELQDSHVDLYMRQPSLSGYGCNQSADLVAPKTEITVVALATYNAWPVHDSRVTFEVRDNHGNLWGILQNDTDDEGHAFIHFRMPWPHEGADDLLGKWSIIASANVGGTVVRDFMSYDYDFLIVTTKLSTDRPSCGSCEWIELRTEYKTKAIGERTVVLSANIYDELGVLVAMLLTELTVGKAPSCTYRNYTTAVNVHIGSFAYAGQAIVRLVFMDALPNEGGEAVSREATTTFQIQPS